MQMLNKDEMRSRGNGEATKKERGKGEFKINNINPNE